MLHVKKDAAQKPAEIDLHLEFSVNVQLSFNGWKVFADDVSLPCQG